MKRIGRRGPWISGSGRRARETGLFLGRSVAFTNFAPAAAALLAAIMLLSAIPGHALASVEKTDKGTMFSYHDPEAGAVFLAGSFNGWNATANPLVRNDSGTWEIVMQLGPGKHEYKYVVDGAWITDFDNPDSAPDPYGGVNSIVELDNQGNILVSEGGKKKLSNTPWNPRVNFDGFFLFSAPVYKNYDGDPRWRMQRPEYGFDLNSIVTINEQVEGYIRLRVDSPSNLVNVNAVPAWMNEAHIRITPPGVMDLRGYYNMEVLQSEDPFHFYGDEDLDGTVFDDHLKIGKGTAGVVFNSDRPGFEFTSFFANIHDADIYNDPDLYDNTGTDLIHLRGSRRFGFVRPGLNYFLKQSHLWLDFTDRIGNEPSNTGIPRLDAHIDGTGDPSDWFEFEDREWYIGADLSFYLLDEALNPSIQYMRGEAGQAFVTSNNSGIDFDNSPIDVPIAERDAAVYFIGVPFTGIDNLFLNARFSRRELLEPGEDESLLSPVFLPNDEANKQISYEIDQDPPEYTRDYGEFEARWTKNDLDARLWIERDLETFEREDISLDVWQYRLSVTPGIKLTLFDDLDLDLEGQYSDLDGDQELGLNGGTIETIVRGNYWFTEKLALTFDVRVINYDLEASASWEETSKTFYNPFVGLRYDFMNKVRLVFAYGIDPVAFDRDYDGRQTGRWDYRQAYLWDNEDATILDAEDALNDVTAFTLRATFRF